MGMGDEFAAGTPDDIDYEERNNSYQEVVPEEEVIEELKHDVQVERLHQVYEKEWEEHDFDSMPTFIPEDRKVGYAGAVELLEDKEYTVEDVEAFCERTELEAGDGQFVSAAIEVADPDRTVELSDMAGVNYVGMRNSHGVEIDGDVGHRAGYRMEAGEIMVHGDAGDEPGRSMEGGKMDITGASGDKPGFGMEAGTLRVGDGCPEDVGPLLEPPAEVYVDDLENVSASIHGGRVYVADGDGHRQLFPPTDRRDRYWLVWQDAKKNGWSRMLSTYMPRGDT